jgi:aspartyl/glutamyl-tRNA(Asn/Gln) amidotransferase, B subunit
MANWETVIGLEVHARLLTRTKAFCGCSNQFGAPPNTHVCPICVGYPGTLPVLNRKAVELAIRVALATSCEIHPESVFARKSYFYPDLPKGYQISQYDRPLATGGRLPIATPSGPKTIEIERIHLEEDSGKLLHEAPAAGLPDDMTLVDLNRAGEIGREIVSRPQIVSAQEAHSYLTTLRQVLMYTGVCDGNMEEGSLRCDANISVRRSGEDLGTRAEIKNLNSFRFLGRAIEFEVERQIDLLERGDRVVQETRLYDANAGKTRSMRSKEEAHDYRYFPEPDLYPLRIDTSWIDHLRSELPELPFERARRIRDEMNIPPADAEALVATRELAEYFEEAAAQSGNARAAANWIKNEVLREVNERKIDLAEYRVSPQMLSTLIRMIDAEEISGKTAKEVFEEMSGSGAEPREIIKKKGLGQISDPAVIRAAAERVIAAHPSQVEQYRGGKRQIFGFLVGQLMKEMRGKAKAETVNAIMRELLGE